MLTPLDALTVMRFTHRMNSPIPTTGPKAKRFSQSMSRQPEMKVEAGVSRFSSRNSG